MYIHIPILNGGIKPNQFVKLKFLVLASVFLQFPRCRSICLLDTEGAGKSMDKHQQTQE